MDEKKFKALSEAQQGTVIKIAKEAERQGVNPELALAIAEAETGGKFSHYGKDGVLTSPAGAKGVMQTMPDTVDLYNKKFNLDIDPNDEDSNIKGGVFILKDLLTQYKKPRNAVALYNASPKAVANFLKTYDTDPDAAIMSLPKETRDYSTRVSKNFNLDDENETGLIAAAKEDEEETEASKIKREEAEKEKKKKEEPAPPPALIDNLIESSEKIDPQKAALAGAAANLFAPMFTDPQLSPRIDTGKATEANLTAQDKLELARQNLNRAVPQGVEDLEKTYQQSQNELERIKNEQKLLEARLKSIPPAPPPAAPIPQEQLQIEARKIAGAGAPYNTVQAMASERVPYSFASQAIDMSHNEGHGRGAHDIVDEFNKAKSKVADLGMSNWVLTGEKGPGELYLPPEIADPKNAEIQQRTEANQNQQAILAQQQEQERLRLQAELERLNQERASRGAEHNVVTGQTKAVAPLRRALTKAETDAEIAQRKLARAQEQPSAAGRVLERAGVASSKIGPIPRTIAGGLAGMAGVMSYQEALKRYKAGDTSEAVLKGLQAGSAGLSLLPPAGKKLTKLRGLGALGAIGSYGYDLGRQVFDKNLPQEP